MTAHWDRIANRMNTVTADWKEIRKEVCSGELAEGLDLVALPCLQQRATEFETVVKVLRELDPKRLNAADTVVAGLPGAAMDVGETVQGPASAKYAVTTAAAIGKR